MQWKKLNESYGYADWAADEMDRTLDREDEIEKITDGLDEDFVCDRYLELYDVSSDDEQIVELWFDMYQSGLIDFKDYLYDGEDWLEEPSASIEIYDDGLYGLVKELEHNPKWKAKLEKYVEERQDCEMDIIKDKFVIYLK